jgi:hypothetical protein
VHELTGWARDLSIEVAGRGLVSHTGSVALRALADRTGLTAAVSSALARRGFEPVHDRGRVLADSAVMSDHAPGGSSGRSQLLSASGRGSSSRRVAVPRPRPGNPKSPTLASILRDLAGWGWIGGFGAGWAAILPLGSDMA